MGSVSLGTQKDDQLLLVIEIYMLASMKHLKTLYYMLNDIKIIKD